MRSSGPSRRRSALAPPARAAMALRYDLGPGLTFGLFATLLFVLSASAIAAFWHFHAFWVYPRFPNNPFLDGFTRWDAGWYQRIAVEGYDFDPNGQSSVAFFPLFPLLTRMVTWVTGLPMRSAIAISLLSGLGVALVYH